MVKKTKIIRIGKLKIGGGLPIRIQSMTNTPTWDIEKTVKQIKELQEAGCEIIRVSVPDLKSAQAIKEIKKQIDIPLVADIHFSDKLALEAIKYGADKIRINPGNFPKRGLGEIVALAKEKNIPIRIGINSGSLEKDIQGKRTKATPEMMMKSAFRNIKLIEKLGYKNLIISLKAPDVLRTVKAHELLSKKTNYPIHIGITEAGTDFSGTIKSSIGIGSLLLKGIGDTIRVSLSADPVEEVKVAWEILKSLELRERGVKIVSCPTCARTKINVIGIAKDLEKLTFDIKKNIKIAVMGCTVNGLGEGKESALAIIGSGDKITLLMKNGKIIKKGEELKILRLLKKEISKIDK